jgi:hypothetical protein
VKKPADAKKVDGQVVQAQVNISAWTEYIMGLELRADTLSHPTAFFAMGFSR